MKVQRHPYHHDQHQQRHKFLLALVVTLALFSKNGVNAFVAHHHEKPIKGAGRLQPQQPLTRTTPLYAAAQSPKENKKKITRKKKAAVDPEPAEPTTIPKPSKNEEPVSVIRKQDLIAAVAASTGMTKSNCELCLNAMIDTIVEQVAAGSKISIAGFGTFQRMERKARKGRNPKTGQELEIPARKAPTFSALGAFKTKVNGEDE